jgi:hypothetical protein
MRSVNLRLTSSTGCQRVKRGPKTILLKLLTILLSGSPCQWWTRQQLTAGLIRRQSQLKKLRAISVKIAALAGTNQFQMFATVSIKKNSLGNKDPVISKREARTASEACTGSGPSIWFFQDHCWKQRHNPNFKPQASSVKHQAPIFRKLQASGDKRQAPGSKRQAPSHKRQAP